METTLKQRTIWDAFWSRAGRVRLRYKIMGIIVAPLLILGLTIAWWVSNQLGGWLSYLLSEERVAQAMAVGMRSVFIITVFAALAGLAIGSFLTWFLTRPLLDMAYVARRVKDGDLSVRAPVWANDEIGELGRAFNDMIASLDTSYKDLERSNEQLQHRNQELAVLYQLADMVSKSFTMQQISSQGLQQALENTGAAAGMTLLLNSQQPMMSACHNLPAPFVDTALACLHDFQFEQTGNAPPGSVLVVEDVYEAGVIPSALILESQKLRYRTLLLAPIQVKADIVGILLMVYTSATGISTRHQRLISGICNQLGVAIQNNQLWEELYRKEEMRSLLLNKVVSAQEDERQRISRELHDETGQALTSLLVQLKIMERYDTLAAMQAKIGSVRQLTQQTLQEVRRLAADLRPAALDDLGLISALEGYIYDYVSKSSLEVDFQHRNMDDIRLPHDMEIVIYRVIQESLTNVLRHAHAGQVQVRIEREGEHIHVVVADDGDGFDVAHVRASKARGLGLLGMQERVELLGGSFSLTSATGHGTQIIVELTRPNQEFREADYER